jgi:tRNA-splicing ligase RtcB
MAGLSENRDAAVAAAAEIGTLPYVDEVIQLPDIHFKKGMEAPSSIVVASKRISPHLVSESINDGMGVVSTSLSVDDATEEKLTRFLAFLNRSGVKTKFAQGKYSWSTGDLRDACRDGAAAAVKRYDLDPSALDVIEDRGRATDHSFSDDDIDRLVPDLLIRSRLTRGEIGLNFGGNHFVEVQVVDEVVDPAGAATVGVDEGQLLVMYHLGPGPLGSMLSNLHAYRKRPPIHRKLGYGAGRIAMHGPDGRAALDTFGRLTPWLAVEPDSAEGRRLAATLALIKNYGFAYRMATVRAVGDGLKEVFGISETDFRLVVDTSHNMLQPETIDGEERWVSRHNCCRPIPGLPGIVAGNNQVSSFITLGPDDVGTSLGGYDHGIGFILQLLAEQGNQPHDPRGLTSLRLEMRRGHEGVLDRKEYPLLESDPLRETVSHLEAAGHTRGVAIARPLATLKHRT